MINENDLIFLSRQGDLEAFNHLVLEYQDLVYNQAYYILREHQSAEDCTQEAFLRAYLNIQNYRGGSFRTWLLKIVSNACYDELRYMKSRPSLPLISFDQDKEDVELLDQLVESGLSVEEKVEQIELWTELQHYLDGLSVEHRSVVVMVDLLEMNYAETARILNIPIGTVKSRLARARLCLQRSLQFKSDLLSGSFTNRRNGDRIDAQQGSTSSQPEHDRA